MPAPSIPVGRTDDPMEYEADRIAARVMRRPPEASRSSRPPASSSPTDLGEPNALATGISTAELRCGGSPLGSATRAFFEPRFARDLSGVRVHTGDRAHGVTHALNARAFAYGNHIWLGAGQREATDHVMAHELAHVVQQADGAPLRARRVVSLGWNAELARDQWEEEAPDPDRATLQWLAIRTFLEAIGAVQARHLGRGHDRHFARAEADALAMAPSDDGRFLLVPHLADAGAGRDPLPPTWAFRRLAELAASSAEVRVGTRRHLATGFGGTDPDSEHHVIRPDGTRDRLESAGPYPTINVFHTTRHPLRRQRPRSLLDMGRTLIHELTIHAWRDALFFQSPIGGGSLSRHRRRVTESRHHDLPHGRWGLGRHALGDYEADLIDHLYDQYVGADPQQSDVRHAREGAEFVGGVMATRIPSLEAIREAFPEERHAEEFLEEHRRFLERARQFEREQRRQRERAERPTVRRMARDSVPLPSQ